MKSKIESAVASIFENYEDTPQMKDFKEEITMNLLERTCDLIKKGMNENEATGKALAELGDITEIADSIGRQKRKEAIGDFFFPRKPLGRGHAVGYSAAGAVLLLGMVVSFVFGYQSGYIGKTLVTFLPFALVSVCTFVFLGVTQETAARYPMGKKRGILYAVAAGLIITGGFLGGMILFSDTRELRFDEILSFKAERISQMAVPSFSLLIAVILPGAAMLCYLILTQEKRIKPWVIERIKRESTVYGEKFGILSGAVWTFAFALFVLLGFLIGWHPAWIVFLFATAAEMIILYFMSS